MKKYQFILILCLTSSFGIKAANFAYDLTDTGTIYLSSANAPLSGNSSFTIELWFNNNNNNYNAYGRLLGFTGYSMDIGLNSGTLVVYDGGWRTTSANNLNTGWHHVAVTNNTSNLFVYVDGVQVYTKTSPAFNFTSKTLYIGCSYAMSKFDRIRAFYDEVRIWNTARTLTQINTDRVKQLVGNETNLVTYYKMNNLSNSTSTANNLSLTGNGRLEPFKFGLYLNDYSLKYDVYDDNTQLSTSTLTGTGDFTIELQFKTSAISSSAYNRLIGWENFELEVALGPGGTLSFYNGTWISTFATNLNDGKWHHLAVSRNAQYLFIIVDNAMVHRANTNINFSGKTYFGGNGWANQPNNISFDGELDEIKIWNKYISQSLLYFQMDSASVGNESNLISYFDMNTPTTNVLNLVPSASNMTRNGTAGTNNLPQFTLASAKAFSPAIRFSNISQRCGAGTLTLTVSPTPGSTVTWYSASSGGASLGSGNSYTTPSISNTTNYYAIATKNGVSTAFRTPVEAKINPFPSISGSASKNNICAGDTIQLLGNGGTFYEFFPSQGLITVGNDVFANPPVTTVYTIIGTISPTFCGDTSTFTVTVNPLPSASVQKVKSTLTALDHGASYQWLECPAKTDILNETNQSFTPKVTGNYAVRVTQNGCVNTSGCVLVDLNVGINSIYNNQTIQLYPNPTNGVLSVESTQVKLINYIIMDVDGRIISNGDIISNNEEINIENLKNGIYIIQLTDVNGNISTLKFIKQ